jgi:hypothetical protein
MTHKMYEVYQKLYLEFYRHIRIKFLEVSGLAVTKYHSQSVQYSWCSDWTRGWTNEKRYNLWKRQEIYLASTLSKLTLGPTQPPIQ